MKEKKQLVRHGIQQTQNSNAQHANELMRSTTIAGVNRAQSLMNPMENLQRASSLLSNDGSQMTVKSSSSMQRQRTVLMRESQLN